MPTYRSLCCHSPVLLNGSGQPPSSWGIGEGPSGRWEGGYQATYQSGGWRETAAPPLPLQPLPSAAGVELLQKAAQSAALCFSLWRAVAAWFVSILQGISNRPSRRLWAKQGTAWGGTGKTSFRGFSETCTGCTCLPTGPGGSEWPSQQQKKCYFQFSVGRHICMPLKCIMKATEVLPGSLCGVSKKPPEAGCAKFPSPPEGWPEVTGDYIITTLLERHALLRQR